MYAAFHVWLMHALHIHFTIKVATTSSSHISVGVLIPARNEAEHIGACIQSIHTQHTSYTYTIYVGNDRSSDHTQQIVDSLSALHPIVKTIPITYTLAGLNGKQNVLAQLCTATTEDILVVVDADCTVEPTWLDSMVSQFDRPEVGMVSGPTVVDGRGLFAQLQALDWRYGMGSFQALAERGLPVTAVGNNMAFRRSAYNAFGGYESLPFSLVEDFQLFKAISSAGYQVRFPASPAILNRSVAVGDWRTLLDQRRRWLRGARNSGAPFHARLPFVMQVLAVAALILALCSLWPWLAAGVFALKITVDTLFLEAVRRRLTPSEPLPWLYLVPHQLYLLLAMLVLPVYLYWPGTTRWKGRDLPS